MSIKYYLFDGRHYLRNKVVDFTNEDENIGTKASNTGDLVVALHYLLKIRNKTLKRDEKKYSWLRCTIRKIREIILTRSRLLYKCTFILGMTFFLLEKRKDAQKLIHFV